MTNEQEFRPHDPIDLEDQNMMLLVLEELAISHMQRYWADQQNMTGEEADLLRDQDNEIREDLLSILQGKEQNEARITPTEWAGSKLASHLRTKMTPIWEKIGLDTSNLNDDQVIEQALIAYLSQTERLVREDSAAKAQGKKGLDPKFYMNFMIEWSGIFSGKGDGFTEIAYK